MTTSRIIGVDVARALALLGMVVAHMRDAVTAADGGIDPWHQVVAGRSSALFAVLAGLSIVLATSSATTEGRPSLNPSARAALACRAVVIATIGVLLGAVAEGIAVILTYYGVLFLCALPVFRWRARSLALLALGWGVTAPVVSLAVRPFLPQPSLDVPAPSSLADPLALTSELFFTGYYPVLTWATYLFVGMAIGRLDLRSRGISLWLALGGGVLAVTSFGISAMVFSTVSVQQSLIDTYDRGDVSDWSELSDTLTTGLFGTTPTGSFWWLAVWSPHTGSMVDLAHTAGCALVIIALAVATTSFLPDDGRRVVSVIFGAGSMTLTLYAVHVLALALPGSWDWAQEIWVHVVVLGGGGAIFAAYRMRGPLEWLVTYASTAVADAENVTRPGRLFRQ